MRLNWFSKGFCKTSDIPDSEIDEQIFSNSQGLTTMAKGPIVDLSESSGIQLIVNNGFWRACFYRDGVVISWRYFLGTESN